MCTSIGSSSPYGSNRPDRNNFYTDPNQSWDYPKKGRFDPTKTSGTSPDFVGGSDPAGSDTPVDSGTDAGTGTPFNAGPNPAIAKWAGGISVAADISGLDPYLLGGQVWAESRGIPTDNSTNSDGTTDYGLMQIGNERWKNEVVPHLTAEQRTKIKAATGLEAEELDMENPQHNLIGGALELSQWIDKNGGNVEEGLFYYVSGGTQGIGSSTYVSDVLEYRDTLLSGGVLRD